MVYGEEKAHEMARSLLPSKNREAARESRARIHRSARRRSRLEMARLTRGPEEYEDLAGLDAESMDSKKQLRWMVWSRRGGDKVAPFVRWATAIARRLPQENRRSHIRARVPRGLIGDHALQHLSHVEGFEHPSEAALREARRLAWARNKSRYRLERGEQAGLLRALLVANGGHHAFNRWLQASHIPRYRKEKRLRPCPCQPGCTLEEEVKVPVGPTRPRLLLGAHDVRPFLTVLWGSPGPRPRWGPTPKGPQGPYAEQGVHVDAFLRAFKEFRGDVAATVKELRLESRMYWRGRPSP